MASIFTNKNGDFNAKKKYIFFFGKQYPVKYQ